MVKEQRNNRIPSSAIVGILAAVVAGGSAAWWSSHSNNPTNPSPRAFTSSPLPTSLQTSPTAPAVQSLAPAAQTGQVYWLKENGTHLELVKSSVKLDKALDKPDAILAAAFNDLLAGPPVAVRSTIPKNTKLRGIKIKSDGIHVNLSQEFTSGGGSDSMTGRVAQVLYTATSLQPDAKVWISVEGKPLTNLGGEGLELEQPITRQSFGRNFSL